MAVGAPAQRVARCARACAAPSGVPLRVSRADRSNRCRIHPQLPLSAHDDWRISTAALDAMLGLGLGLGRAPGGADTEQAEAEAAAVPAALRRAAASDDW